MQVKFVRDEGFHKEITRRVDEYFRTTGLSRRDDPRMFLKTAVILLWFWGSWALLVFAATTWWEGMLLSASVALAMAGIGFSVQHDANHGAYSNRRGVNHLVGLTLDMLGGSSYVWRWKHNVYHHMFPNVVGADDDIDIGPLARMAPGQPLKPVHRFQQFYMWFLYCFLAPKWHFVDDFKNSIQGRIVLGEFPRPRGWALVELLAGKLVFLAWALVIPMMFHRWWVVLLCYAWGAALVGLVMSAVFQAAHCVEEADFPEPRDGADHVTGAWAVRQVETSVDFAQKNPFITWYVGGLNFQIEHHLLPKVCHIHYPALAPIVREVSAQYGVRYYARPGFLGAVAAHGHWLKRMGREAHVPATAATAAS